MNQMTLPRKRLPFDLPPRTIYQLEITAADYASLVEGSDEEVEVALLLEQAYYENIHELEDSNKMIIGIVHRWGLTAKEARSIEDVSQYIRDLTQQIYELIDMICEATGRSVEEVQDVIDGLQSSKYLPPFIRPYLDRILTLKDKTPTYQERLSTLHLQRTIPEWTAEHTQALRPGITAGLNKFAGIEAGIEPVSDEKKSEPEGN
jgi:hypothetical protein